MRWTKADEEMRTGNARVEMLADKERVHREQLERDVRKLRGKNAELVSRLRCAHIEIEFLRKECRAREDDLLTFERRFGALR